MLINIYTDRRNISWNIFSSSNYDYLAEKKINKKGKKDPGRWRRFQLSIYATVYLLDTLLYTTFLSFYVLIFTR